MSKVWIIGANGMLGTAIHDRLIIDHELIATGSELDVTDTFLVTKWAKRLKPKYIINCSAYTNVDGAEVNRDQARKLNVDGPMNVAIAASLTGAKALHFSTDYVFDGSKPSYRESDRVKPLNWYGKTKYDGEHRFCSLSDDCFIIRTSWLFSEHRHNFVKTMLRLFKERSVVSVVNDQIGRPTYAPYLAMISSKLLFDYTDTTGVWHVANSGNASWYQFAVYIHDTAREMGLIKKDVKILPITSQEYPQKAERPKFSVLDTKRVEDHLGSPLLPWKQSLQDCLRSISKG